MLKDSKGMRPHEYTEMKPNAFCPDCGGMIYKRGGGVGKVMEHWAHFPNTDRECAIRDCPVQETDWHRLMKDAFEIAGFQVEVSVTCNGNRYRADAAYQGKYVEFLNTFSTYYETKALDFLTERHFMTWIFNGDHFADFAFDGYHLGGSALRLANRLRGFFMDCYVLTDGCLMKVNHVGRAVINKDIYSPFDFARHLVSFQQPSPHMPTRRTNADFYTKSATKGAA